MKKEIKEFEEILNELKFKNIEDVFTLLKNQVKGLANYIQAIYNKDMLRLYEKWLLLKRNLDSINFKIPLNEFLLKTINPGIKIILIAGGIGTAKTTFASNIGTYLTTIWNEKIEIISDRKKIFENIEKSKKKIFYIILEDELSVIDSRKNYLEKLLIDITHKQLEKDIRIYLCIITQDLQILKNRIIKNSPKLIILKSYFGGCAKLIHDHELEAYLRAITHSIVTHKLDNSINYGILIAPEMYNDLVSKVKFFRS